MAHRIARLAAGAALLLGAQVAHAQVTIDLLGSSGGFTNQNLVGNNPWFWTAGQGWRVNSAAATGGLRSRLITSELVTTQSDIAVVVTHRFNFEPSGSNCFDGGAIFQSIEGSAFSQITNGITGVGYTGTISSSFGNPMAGLRAFCGTSTGFNTGSFVTTTLSGTSAVGLKLRLGFDGGWDSSVTTSNPNWQLASIELRGFQVVPEPSTYALLATGLVALGVVARRRRA